MNLLATVSFIYFIFAAFPFANAQTASPAFEIFQRDVYPFLQQRCAQCHGKNQFDAPQHSPIGDPKTSYSKILGYVHLTQDWEKTSTLISYGGIRHCQDYLGAGTDCGADRAEILATVRNWIQAEIAARSALASNAPAPKKNQAQHMITSSEKLASSNQNANSKNKSLKIIQVAAGAYHTCALFENKKVKCWGRNDVGQLGIGSEKSTLGITPEEIQTLPYVLIHEPILEITVGGNHNCALLDNKKAKCWGNNNGGQLGIGSDKTFFGKTPQEMQSLPYVMINEPILKIAAGGNHTCALLQNKKAKCWGYNGYGQLGIGSNKNFGQTDEDMQTLPDVLINEPILKIAVGGSHTCAVLENKKAKCWGDNAYGQLGIGSKKDFLGQTAKDMQTLPDVLINEPILKIAAGGSHTCAVLENKKAKCWGYNYYGQLGIGSNIDAFGRTPEDMHTLPHVLINEPIAKIAAGLYHSCVLLESKHAKCWGGNDVGQLGAGLSQQNIGKTSNEMLRLTEVLIFDNILQISTSSLHTCVLIENGKIKCWGFNDAGQLGTGDNISRGIVDIDDSDELPDALVTAVKEEQ